MYTSLVDALENRKMEDQLDWSFQVHAIARVCMLHWDRQFLALTRENSLNMHLYSTYIDDQNIIMQALPMGTRWNGEKLIIMQNEVEIDRMASTSYVRWKNEVDRTVDGE